MRQRWLEITAKLYGAVETVQEIDEGYACRLPGDAQTLRDVAEYVGLDRLCCAHLRWTIRVEPEHRELWLAITGATAAKAALREGFETTDLLPLAVAKEAGFDVKNRRSVRGLSAEQVARDVNDAAERHS